MSVIGKNVTAIAGDLSRLEDVDRISAAVKAGKGFVDIVVSNAGLTEQGSIDSLTPPYFDKVFDLNITFRKYQKGKLENG